MARAHEILNKAKSMFGVAYDMMEAVIEGRAIVRIDHKKDTESNPESDA